MIRTRFHSLLRERIERQVEQDALSLSTGSLLDHAAYKYACGRIAGMRAVLNVADAIEGEFNGGVQEQMGR